MELCILIQTTVQLRYEYYLRKKVFESVALRIVEFSWQLIRLENIEFPTALKRKFEKTIEMWITIER